MREKPTENQCTSYSRRMLDTWLSQPDFDSKCLTFLVLHGSQPGVEGETVLRRVAQTYSLETGLVSWRHPSQQPHVPILLRGNSRLASWEPMTSQKFALMALDRGSAGEAKDMPGRVAWPQIAAVVVSPQGFVFRWEDSSLCISDVKRLANISEPLANGQEGWNEYQITYTDKGRIVVGPGFGETALDRAWVGNGEAPLPNGPDNFKVPTLAAYNNVAALPILESENDPCGDYAPEAVAFVGQQFGVDPNAVDWQAANAARFASEQFSHSAPFDPVAACSALRLAGVSSKIQSTAPPAINRKIPPAIAAQVQRHPSPRPTQ